MPREPKTQDASTLAPKEDSQRPDAMPPEQPRDGDSEQEPLEEKNIPLSHTERMSAVCELFARGYSVTRILAEMKKRYGKGGKMNREMPYKLVREAGALGYIKFAPPPHLTFGRRISDHYYWLQQVNVVRTVVSMDVARETAKVLLRLVQQRHDADQSINEVHIGFAAGLSMRQVAQCFAELLSYPVPGLPKRIVIHAMLSGHDPGNPTTDPNSFFTFFLHPPALHSKLRFVGFRAPTIVRQSHIPIFTEIHDIREAYEKAADLDIIVTSGSDWDDPHSSLRRCMERSPSTLQTLRDEGALRDMLWRPLGETSPITTETEIRALTLMELDDLPDFINRGKHVLLMLGPCAVCGRHKGPVLDTILSQVRHLASHIVTDSRTGGYVVNILDERQGGHA
jgi:hypothetical protein